MPTENNRSNVTWTLIGMCVLTLALAVRFDEPLHGEIRPREPQPHFKSGGERSEALLREMLTTLKTIDQRLERMERLVRRAGSGGPS